MKPRSIRLHPLSSLACCVFLFVFLCGSASAEAQGYGSTDTVVILKMFNGNQPSSSAVLTITEPCTAQRSPNCGKPVKGNYAYNPNKQYPSGTTFQTHDNYTILLRSNGVISQVTPGSSNMVKVRDGNEVHHPKGRVQIVADKARDLSKSIIIKGQRVSAKMKTTEFWVDSRGDQTTFSPVEGTIEIVEKVPVKIGNTVFKDTSENREKARDATYPKVTELTAGQSDYVSGNLGYHTYDSLVDGINQLNNYIQEYGSQLFAEELAELYTLLGEFYLAAGSVDYAITSFQYALENNQQIDPYDLATMESWLFYCEAQMLSSNQNVYNSGFTSVSNITQYLQAELNYYYEEYQYAVAANDYDMQVSYCFDLKDASELMGWAYDLLNNEAQADEYYNYADSLSCGY